MVEEKDEGRGKKSPLLSQVMTVVDVVLYGITRYSYHLLSG